MGPAGQLEKDDLKTRLVNRCSVTFHKINVHLLLFRFSLFSSSFLFLSFPSKTINKLDETNETKEEESIDIFIDEVFDAVDSPGYFYLSLLRRSC